MKYKPHEYQTYATQFIDEHPVSAIFLDMGLGKTVLTLTSIFDLLYDYFLVSRVLVIAPLRVARDTWPEEIQKWDHLHLLSYAVAVGSEEQRKAALLQNADITIINRENVTWLIEQSGLPFDFDMVIIDELSSFKSWKAKRFRSLKLVRPFVKRIVGLTGTPASNGLMDLFAEFRILDKGERLGKYITGYRDNYFRPENYYENCHSYVLLPGAKEKIYTKISDITISMTSADYLQLPSLITNTVSVEMSKEEKKIYDTMAKQMVVSLQDTEIDAANAAVLVGKLSQMANGAIYDENKKAIHIHDRKLDALEDLVEAANGKPVLVAYWYQHDLERIKTRLPQARQLLSSKDIQDWCAGTIPVALIHPASAGHGLNLQTGGSTLIWFGLTWSLELYQQTNARLHRQGQTETVVVHHIVTKGTVDEDILKALEQKDLTQQSLINAVKKVIQ
jgi:SNF2 family DNA or RNA helicase